MNDRLEDLLYQSGLTAQGCWDELDDYARQGIEKFAELIVAECAQACINMGNDYEIKSAGQYQAELFAFAIKKHFGVEE